MASWYFPSNDHGENKGINDSGVAMFRGTPLKSLAREICQNSLDAANEGTVRVEFSCFDIPRNSIPGADVLEKTFEACSSYWGGQRAKGTRSFFENAISRIREEKISVLRISDFNTKGLTGSSKTEDIHTNWMGLTKSSGSCDKKGPAGGSFGIGKFAPFACSDFSTVFYSTCDIEGECAYQGVSRLVTFKRDDEETTQGTGYYGNEKNTPVFETLNIDPNFGRNQNEYGTDIYVLGYHYAKDDWTTSLIVSILDSFLGAIWDEKLEVMVGDISINKGELPNLMEEYAESLNGTYVLEYYQVLTNPDTKWVEANHLNLGTIKLGYLLNGNDFHRKVAMIRQNGMKIKDADRINGYIPFAGVLFIEGDGINERLRALENPEHTEWQPDRVANPIEARHLIKSLNDFMKKQLEVVSAQGEQPEIDAIGVANFLPDISNEDKETGRKEAVSDEVVEIGKRVKETSFRAGGAYTYIGGADSTVSVEGEGGGEEMGWAPKPERHPKPDVPPRPPMPVHPDPGARRSVNVLKRIELSKFICFCQNPDEGKYGIMFTPMEDSPNGTLRFFLSGEDGRYDASIVSASQIEKGPIEINGNALCRLNFEKENPIRIVLQLDYRDYCTMEVEAYANEE